MIQELGSAFQTITPMKIQSSSSQEEFKSSSVICFAKKQWILADANAAICNVYVRLFRNCMKLVLLLTY